MSLSNFFMNLNEDDEGKNYLFNYDEFIKKRSKMKLIAASILGFIGFFYFILILIGIFSG